MGNNWLEDYDNHYANDMIKKLTEIRNELLTGVEKSDLLYIKMQINKIDTLLYGTQIWHRLAIENHRDNLKVITLKILSNERYKIN